MHMYVFETIQQSNHLDRNPDKFGVDIPSSLTVKFH